MSSPAAKPTSAAPLPLLFAVWLATAASAQEPPPLPGVIPGERRAPVGEWIAADGAPAAAGRVPEGTDPIARERFAKVVKRLAAPNELRAFTLRFDALSRTADAMQEFKAEFSYLDAGPGWVRGATLNNDGSVKQTQMRGPQGDGRPGYWHRTKDGTLVELVGPDNVEGREQLDGWAALCHDFLLLQQPGRLRLMRVAPVAVKGLGTDGLRARAVSFGDNEVVLLPDVTVRSGDDEQPLAARAAALEWLEVVTPDIRLFRDGVGVEAQRRVVLGLDAEGVPELALLTARVEGALIAPGASLLHLSGWHAYGATAGGAGHPLPRATVLYELREPDTTESKLTRNVFSTRATIDLFLLEGGVIGGTPPKPESFRPQ